MRKTLNWQGIEMVYEVRGSGKPIMLVHGFTEDRTIWYPLIREISDKYYWILPDLPGSGESFYNRNLIQLSDFADLLRAILETENIDQFILIGHSMGGYISLAFADKFPSLIRGLGLFHSSAYPDNPEKKETRDKNIRFILKNGAGLYVEQAIPGLFSEKSKVDIPEEIGQLISRYANFSPESLVSYLEAMKQRPDTTDVLKLIQKPVLFIMGEEDKAVTMKDGLELCHLPGISYIHILTQTAHMGMIENTRLSASIVDRFLDEIPV